MACIPSRGSPAGGWPEGRWRGSPVAAEIVRDYERQPGHHETYVCWAMITVITHRLARQLRPLSHMPPEFSSS